MCQALASVFRVPRFHIVSEIGLVVGLFRLVAAFSALHGITDGVVRVVRPLFNRGFVGFYLFASGAIGSIFPLELLRRFRFLCRPSAVMVQGNEVIVPDICGIYCRSGGCGRECRCGSARISFCGIRSLNAIRSRRLCSVHRSSYVCRRGGLPGVTDGYGRPPCTVVSARWRCSRRWVVG